jgi:hypothetical protein
VCLLDDAVSTRTVCCREDFYVQGSIYSLSLTVDIKVLHEFL